jgi:hypothetical protein
MRLLKSDKVPLLKGLTAIPLVLNPDKDAEIETLTEGRLDCFNHAVRKIVLGFECQLSITPYSFY